MPRREHDTCGETLEAKEETQEQKKKEDYHPKRSNSPPSRNCFFVASTTSISLRISSTIFFILSMTRDLSLIHI